MNQPRKNVQREVILFVHTFVALALVASTVTASAKLPACFQDLTSLSQQQRDLLLQYGAVTYKGELIVSASVVSDCATRKAMSQLLTDVIIRGNITKADQDFAIQNRPVVNRVVKKVWPIIAESPAVPSDGTLGHDKWRILLEPTLTDRLVSALAGDNIRTAGIGSDSAYLLLHRHLRILMPRVREILDTPKTSVSEKLYAVAILSQENGARLAIHLDEIARQQQLTETEKSVLAKLQQVVHEGNAATWKDVQALVEED